MSLESEIISKIGAEKYSQISKKKWDALLELLDQHITAEIIAELERLQYVTSDLTEKETVDRYVKSRIETLKAKETQL